MNAPDIRKAQIASLRSMAELFGRDTGAFSQAVRRDLKDTADRMEWCGEDLETLLWERKQGGKL